MDNEEKNDLEDAKRTQVEILGESGTQINYINGMGNEMINVEASILCETI